MQEPSSKNGQPCHVNQQEQIYISTASLASQKKAQMNGIENKISRKRSLTSNGESESASSSYSLNDILHDQNLIQKGFYLDTNIVQALGSNRMHMLWDCWELALTNQPFMLVGDSPAICGQAIFAILSLISPLEYIGDFRPYFT